MKANRISAKEIKEKRDNQKKEVISFTLSRWIINGLIKEKERLKASSLSNLVQDILTNYLLLPLPKEDKKKS